MKRIEDRTEEDLMVSYALGDYKAFRELYDRHSGKVLGYLKKRLPDTGEAEDLMQTVFLKLHQSRETYEPKYPFLAWLFTVTRNVMIDHLRKKKNFPMEELKLQALAGGTSQGVTSEIGWKEVLQQLPEKQRNVLELRFAEGLSFEEIALRSGTSEVSVRKRISRAVQKVKSIFGTENVE